jgi:hypothetical protein
MSTNFYPTEMRATGTGWTTFFGRLGGISGASVGAVLLAFHLTMGEIFWFMCLPIGIGIIASFLKGRLMKKRADADQAVPAAAR